MIYNTKDLEVFVLTYNRAQFLQQTLISLCDQTAQGFRIVVLDNGSTDNTPEIVKSFETKGVELCRSEQNLGHIGNFNRAKELASRKWVMVFHDDDLLHPNYIEVAMNLIDKYQNIVLIGSAMTFEGNPKNDYWQKLTAEVICCKKASDFATLLYRGFPFHFGSTIYRTDLFKSIPMEWETYGKIVDRPFLFDIAKYGGVLIFKKPYVKYRLHSGQDSIDINSVPFIHQMIALHQKYLELLGSSPFTSSGRAFLLMNYKYLCDEHVRIFKRDKLSINQLIKIALDEKGSTKSAVWCGKVIKNCVNRNENTLKKVYTLWKMHDYI